MTLAGKLSLTALDRPSKGLSLVNRPAIKLGISLTDTTGSLGVSMTSGGFTIQTTILLRAISNPASGVASTVRLVELRGSVRITSITTTSVPEFA